jgi:diketogulonate reductase-like aldo/keto reductase
LRRYSKETWRVLEEELAAGRCRAIGVSNYTAAHLDELATYARVMPAVNQVEMHPRRG